MRRAASATRIARSPSSSEAAQKRAIWLGALALRHPAYADLRALAAALAAATGASLGVLAEGGNAAGAYLAGAVPHREAGGVRERTAGMSARDMLREAADGYVLFGGVEPWVDDARQPGAVRSARGRGASSSRSRRSPTRQLKRSRTCCCPIGTFAETSGTYVNLEGLWQSFAGAAQPLGEARPGWKVLRVLGNLLALAGFEYQSSEEVREELRARCADIAAAPTGSHERPQSTSGAPARRGAGASTCRMYQVDAARAPRALAAADARRRTRAGAGLRRRVAHDDVSGRQWLALRGPAVVRASRPAWILLRHRRAHPVAWRSLTLWERKVIGWMQLRKGPNRVGASSACLPGIGQPFADVIKLLIKEVVIPANVEQGSCSASRRRSR